jgi:hypothetical protein
MNVNNNDSNWRLTGRVNMHFDDHYDNYDLDDFAVGNGVNIKRLQPIAIQFDWHKEGESKLILFCLPRGPKKKDPESPWPIRKVIFHNYDLLRFMSLLDACKMQVHVEFKPEVDIEFDDIFTEEPQLVFEKLPDISLDKEQLKTMLNEF